MVPELTRYTLVAITALTAGAGGPVLSPAIGGIAGIAHGDRDVMLTGGDVAFIVGGSGDPIPSQDYVDTNNGLFVQPNFPGFEPQALFTPEGNYALFSGVKSLTLDASEAQDVKIMDDAVLRQVADGGRAVISGFSQSSTASSMLMPQLAEQLHAQGVPDDHVGFVLVGDPNLPNGGLFERLDGVTIPSLGITFNGATPDDLFPTTIYTAAYDGFADVPRYPIDFLADLNSLLGIPFVHSVEYSELTPEQIADAVKMPTEGDTLTDYYMIPLADEHVPYLPLLQPLLDIPGIGKPLADFLEPILVPLVNLGYGDPDFAWSQGPANVPVEFGLFPQAEMVEKAFTEAAQGFSTGLKAAMADLAAGGTDGGDGLGDGSDMVDAAPHALPSLTDIVNTLTSAFSTAYSALLPSADVATGLSITVPNVDLGIFLDGLKSGDLAEALLQPMATNTYLDSLGVAFEIFALRNVFEDVSADLSGLFS